MLQGVAGGRRGAGCRARAALPVRQVEWGGVRATRRGVRMLLGEGVQQGDGSEGRGRRTHSLLSEAVEFGCRGGTRRGVHVHRTGMVGAMMVMCMHP